MFKEATVTKGDFQLHSKKRFCFFLKDTLKFLASLLNLYQDALHKIIVLFHIKSYCNAKYNDYIYNTIS